MKYLIDFLENKAIEETHIFSQLKCTVEEAKILQLLTRKFLQSQEDVIVAELLQELHGADDYSYLSHFGEVKTLLELGWITHNSFTPIKISELSHLEYLQDQFFRIELYQKMSIIRHNGNEHSLGINRIQNKLDLLEKRIDERIPKPHLTLSSIAFSNKRNLNLKSR